MTNSVLVATAAQAEKANGNRYIRVSRLLDFTDRMRILNEVCVGYPRVWLNSGQWGLQRVANYCNS